MLFKPHSIAWFDHLQKKGDAQSLMLAQCAELHIEKNKHNLEVCSICGDTPSKEMKLKKLTMRLCEDCQVIRVLHYQEMFEPISPEEYES